jgi:phenylacetate-CoA ligase
VTIMPDLYTKLVSNVIFPLQERIKGHDTVAVRRAMEESQWWSSERLREYQAQRLRGFLIEVGSHVAYYRDLFRSLGFHPEAVDSTAALTKLPTLTKSLIRANVARLQADNARGLARFNTGGSSGEPLIFWIGKERVTHDVAAKWRATRWWGVEIGDPEVVVWGSPIELGAQDRVRKIRDRLMRTELLPAFEMSESKLDEFITSIRKSRPRMLFGYPSSISLLARHAEKRGIVMNDLGIKVAFVTSERLFDEQRETIARTFGCRVANGYGGRDAGFIAHECPEGGMHTTAEDIIVEVLDEEGRPVRAGVAGEIVVTHLATSSFPFIRYRTGDVGILDPGACACGRGLPLLREIQGRTTDFVVASDGTVMHGLALIYVLRDLPGIESFKIVQERRDFVRVLLVRGRQFEEAHVDRICQGFRRRLGEDVAIDIEMVERISPEASGKFRYVTSRVHLQT